MIGLPREQDLPTMFYLLDVSPLGPALGVLHLFNGNPNETFGSVHPMLQHVLLMISLHGTFGKPTWQWKLHDFRYCIIWHAYSKWWIYNQRWFRMYPATIMMVSVFWLEDAKWNRHVFPCFHQVESNQLRPDRTRKGTNREEVWWGAVKQGKGHSYRNPIL